jgi:hypothetical protein
VTPETNPTSGILEGAQQKKAPPECANTRGAGTYQIQPGGTVYDASVALSTAEDRPYPQGRGQLPEPLHISKCIAEFVASLPARAEGA